MPDTALSRKRQIIGQCDLSGAHQLPTRVAGWIGLPFPTPIEVSRLHRGNPISGLKMQGPAHSGGRSEADAGGGRRYRRI